MDQNRTPVLDAIREFGKRNRAYFCIPGHRGSRGVLPEFTELFGETLFEWDLTEAEGLDDLHHPKTAIKEAQELSAALYGADKTWFLVNGTTCGNEAMILSSVLPGEEIILPRNVHKSVLMGLILSGAKPAWILPKEDRKHGISGEITPDSLQTAFRKHPKAKAALVVSPTYYGICSDLKTLAEICHDHGAMLLVDAAHGSHLGFSELLPPSAMQCGADMTAQSTHKTAGSFTQSSMLHVQGTLVDHQRVDDNLKLVMSTSPSYLLMASLDAARCYMAREGKGYVERGVLLCTQAKEKLRNIPGVEVVPSQDGTRLVFSAARAGISGYELKDRLYQTAGISLEMADPFNVVAVVTGANEECEIRLLTGTVQAILAGRDGKALCSSGAFSLSHIPEMKYTPREAYFMKKESVAIEKSMGQTAGEMVAPYPPGIPIVYPGEIIDEKIYDLLVKCRREKPVFHGPMDDTLEMIRILKEEI